MSEIITFLGFDVGHKKTGVAIANSLTNHAKGLTAIQHNKNGQIDWVIIDKLIKEYTPSKVIIGLPLHHGQYQKATYQAKKFGNQLSQKYKLLINYTDEYLSSMEAKQQLKWHHNHSNAKYSDIDKQSAAVILQTWLNTLI